MYNFNVAYTFQDRIAPILLEIYRDNLHMKFLAFNVDFNNLGLD